MTDQKSTGPLHRVRVLDATADLGRMAGRILTDFGADVVRVLPGERGPDLGADLPGLLELWHDGGTERIDLDLDRPEGVETFKRLARHSDIIVDDRPRPDMADRGLAPEDLAALNPRLVQVSLSPQGSAGPRADWRSSDLVAQALGGYLSVTGDPDRPVALWGRQAAMVGGFYAATSALAGLHRSRLRGRGSWVDLSLHQALISCSEHLLMYWWFAEALAPLGAPIATRQRSLHWIRAFEVVPCARGACMVSPAAGGLLDLIAWLKGRGHAADIPDDPDAEQLLNLVPALMEALRAVALESDATDLFEAGQSLHVPFGEAYAVDQVAHCPQHRARGFFQPVVPAPAGDVDLRLPGPLARFQATPLPAPEMPVQAAADQVVARWQPDPHEPQEAVEAGEGRLPLAGLTVLDFTHVLAGPFATRLLADLGADVIRVQTEERSSGGASANDFPYNVLWARSKRSVQLQMKHPRAMEVLQRLVERADVVIDNFSAGVMDGWGAGPDRLAEWNPAIISLSMSGCGADGPWQDYVTYAPTVHALCGLTALTGPAGEADCGPGIAYNDHLSGLAGAVAVLSAVEARTGSGRGQHIDMSQFEIGTYLVGPALVDYIATGRIHRSAGNADPFAPHPVNDVFRTGDGQWLAVTLFDQEDLGAVEALGVGAGGDAGSVSGRVADWVAGRSGAEAQRLLQEAGLAAGLVQNASHLVEDDDQLAHRDWLVTMDSPMLGTQTTERHPGRWHVGGEELAIDYRPSPYLGEHNFEVYEELLGWDAEQVALAIGDELIL